VIARFMSPKGEPRLTKPVENWWRSSPSFSSNGLRGKLGSRSDGHPFTHWALRAKGFGRSVLTLPPTFIQQRLESGGR
jgi:hypothetical protein